MYTQRKMHSPMLKAAKRVQHIHNIYDPQFDSGSIFFPQLSGAFCASSLLDQRPESQL